MWLSKRYSFRVINSKPSFADFKIGQFVRVKDNPSKISLTLLSGNTYLVTDIDTHADTAIGVRRIDNSPIPRQKNGKLIQYSRIDKSWRSFYYLFEIVELVE